MKTKGLIYLLSIIFVVLLASCEEEHIMTKFDDYASFVEGSFFVSAKANETIEISVTHRNLGLKGSNVKLEIKAADGTPSTVATLNKDLVNFDESDTVTVTLAIDYNSLIVDQVFSVIVGFSNINSYGGNKEVVVEMTKWRPRKMSDFVGTYFVDAISGYSPGEYDEEWEDVTTVADAVDNTKLLITGIAGSTEVVEAFLDFDAMTITIPAGQNIGDVYEYGDMVIYNFDGNDITMDDLVGTLYENNDFYFEYMVPYQLAEGWYWDIYTATFIKE